MSYVSTVADSILSRSGCVSILAPEIYTAIAEWEKKEIPLPIVIISIDEVCGDDVNTNSTLKSMETLQTVVSKNFRIWLVSRSTPEKAAGRFLQ